MMRLKVPVVCVVIGEGASGGALGIGVGDRVCMLENKLVHGHLPRTGSSISGELGPERKAAQD